LSKNLIFSVKNFPEIFQDFFSSLNETFTNHNHDDRYLSSEVININANAYGISFTFCKIGRIIQLRFDGAASQVIEANKESYITEGITAYGIHPLYGPQYSSLVSDWSTNHMALVFNGNYLYIRPIGSPINEGDLVRGSIVYISNT